VGIRCTPVAPLLKVDIGGVGRMPLWRSLYQQQIILKQAILKSTAITTLAGPHDWLPIQNHTSAPSTKSQVKTKIKDDTGVNTFPPTTAIPFVVVL
jgi:hypothetical protein